MVTMFLAGQVYSDGEMKLREALWRWTQNGVRTYIRSAGDNYVAALYF